MERNPNIQQNTQPDGPDDNNDRVAVLNLDQVRRLDHVMAETVVVYGRGNFPALEVRLRDLTALVRDKLLEQRRALNEYEVFASSPASMDADERWTPMAVSSIRLNGGAASHVLCTRAEPYNDVDLMFNVAVSAADNDGNGCRRHFDRVKSAVLKALVHLLPEGVSRRRMTPRTIREAYVGKMVMVCNDYDRWSLISLGAWPGHRNVELKFVDRMRRAYEFSIDSFQITVDPLLLYHQQGGVGPYPTVFGESAYGRFRDAMQHLEGRVIATVHPEQIRGGGLLKYCNLLSRNYALGLDRVTLERAMCSKFFADFPEVPRQRVQMLNYILNHLPVPDEDNTIGHYLTVLGMVIEYHVESSVVPQRHFRTLCAVSDLTWYAFQAYFERNTQMVSGQHQQHQHHQHHQHPFHHHHQHHQMPFYIHHQLHHHHQMPFHIHHQQLPFHIHHQLHHHQHQFPFQQFHHHYHPSQYGPCFYTPMNIPMPTPIMWQHPHQNQQHRPRTP